MPENFKPELGSGDDGLTGLPSGKRVKKTDHRIRALGLLDELGALLGLAKVKLAGKKEAVELLKTQRTLLKAAAHAAGLDFKTELKKETRRLEAGMELLAAGAKPLREFILPGRTETEALLHLCRAKARLCEAALWEINSTAAAVYLNRLSDHLFLLAAADDK
ncbi:MAG: ATP:cob(I)alamin adenosyltransferase [Elusimicrobiales bacterium]|jgi:cob(I)alamin adenosyltransferase